MYTIINQTKWVNIMKANKLFATVTLALAMAAISTLSAFAAEPNEITPDMDTPCIGQSYVTRDGARYDFIGEELVKSRMTSTVYNGYVFDHDSWWESGPSYAQAHATTTSYLKGDASSPHRNYTLVRVVNSLFPSVIYEDTGRQWSNASGVSSASSKPKQGYTDRMNFAMRSYWGDETT